MFLVGILFHIFARINVPFTNSMLLRRLHALLLSSIGTLSYGGSLSGFIICCARWRSNIRIFPGGFIIGCSCRRSNVRYFSSLFSLSSAYCLSTVDPTPPFSSHNGGHGVPIISDASYPPLPFPASLSHLQNDTNFPPEDLPILFYDPVSSSTSDSNCRIAWPLFTPECPPFSCGSSYNTPFPLPDLQFLFYDPLSTSSSTTLPSQHHPVDVPHSWGAIGNVFSFNCQCSFSLWPCSSWCAWPCTNGQFLLHGCSMHTYPHYAMHSFIYLPPSSCLACSQCSPHPCF